MRQPSLITSSGPAGLPEYIPVAPQPRRRRVPVPVIVAPRLRRNDRGERMLTVAVMFDGQAQRPMIRLRGAWLEELGFPIGARIVVSEERGRIVLTIEGEERRQ